MSQVGEFFCAYIHFQACFNRAQFSVTGNIGGNAILRKKGCYLTVLMTENVGSTLFNSMIHRLVFVLVASGH